MARYELTTRLYDIEGNPTGDLRKRVIDTSVDRKYDGAKTLDDIKKTFLESVTQDPLHGVFFRVEDVRILEQ